MAEELPYAHNRLFYARCDENKETSVSLGVYNGNASFSIFHEGKNVERVPLSTYTLTMIKRTLRHLLDKPNPDTKLGIALTKWNPETKKSDPKHNLVLGRNDKNVVYLRIASAAGKFTFSFRGDFSVELVGTADPMTDAQKSDIAAESLIDVIKYYVSTARMLTSRKRPNNNNNSGGSSNRSSSSDDDFTI